MTHSEIHPIQDWIRNYFQQPSGMWRNHPLLKNFRGNVLIGNRRMMDLVSNLFLPFGWAVASLRSDRVLLDRLMRLSRAVPAGEVPVTITTDGQTTVEPHTLLFTPADWNLLPMRICIFAG